MYEIPQQLEYKEKIVFGLHFEQLAWAFLFFPISFIILFRLHIPLFARVFFAMIPALLGAGFMFFNLKEHSKNWYIWYKSRYINSQKQMQQIFGIKDINENMIITTKNKKLAVLKVESINFQIKPQIEQEAITHSFQKLLNSLDFPVQILMTTEVLSIADYLKSLKEKITKKKDEAIYNEYKENLESFLKKNNVLNRNFYVVIPEINDIDIQIKLCEDRLNSLNLKTRRMKNNDFERIFRQIFDSGENISILPRTIENNVDYLKVSKKYINGNTKESDKHKIFSYVKQKCSCKKGDAEGFCFICNEPVCSECGEKTRLHYSCNARCDNCSDNFIGKCANCQKDACSHCSKEVWSHFSENCIKEPEKVVVGILEVDHECWFADLSEKLDNPVVLDSFMDDKDPILKTHSGRIVIESSDKEKAIKFLLNHKQITEVKPLYLDKKAVFRTRALFKKSVDESVRKNKSVLLNPIKATDTKERNLIISPSKKEILRLLRVLNETGKCRIIESEEVEMGRFNKISSKQIAAFVNVVDKGDLVSAMQRIRLMKRVGE